VRFRANHGKRTAENESIPFFGTLAGTLARGYTTGGTCMKFGLMFANTGPFMFRAARNPIARVQRT